MSQFLSEGPVPGEIDIGFVYHYNTEIIIQYHFYIFSLKRIACRVIGRTQEDHFCMVVNGLFNGGEIELEVRCQVYLFNFGIIDICAYLVHSISRRTNNEVINAWFAKGPDQDVYTFVASIAQEDIFNRHPFYCT